MHVLKGIGGDLHYFTLHFLHFVTLLDTRESFHESIHTALRWNIRVWAYQM